MRSGAHTSTNPAFTYCPHDKRAHAHLMHYDEVDGSPRRKAAEHFESLGASVEEVSLPTFAMGLPAYYVIASSEASSNLARYDGVRYGLRTDAADLAQVQLVAKTCARCNRRSHFVRVSAVNASLPCAADVRRDAVGRPGRRGQAPHPHGHLRAVCGVLRRILQARPAGAHPGAEGDGVVPRHVRCPTHAQCPDGGVQVWREDGRPAGHVQRRRHDRQRQPRRPPGDLRRVGVSLGNARDPGTRGWCLAVAGTRPELAHTLTPAVPCGFVDCPGESEPLPVGLQIVGRAFGEAAIVGIADAYQKTATFAYDSLLR